LRQLQSGNDPPVAIAEVLRETVDLYRRLFARTVVTALIVFVSLELALAALTHAADVAGGVLLVGLLSLLLSVAGTELVQGALAAAVRDVHEGREVASPSELFSRTRPHLVSLIGAALLVGLGVAIGFIFVIIPGLILWTRWSLTAPVVVLENLHATAAMRRSRELVRGHAWTVFWVLLLVYVTAIAVSFALSEALRPLPTFFTIWIGGAISASLTAPFIAHALAVIYYKLREPNKPVIAPAKTWHSIWDNQPARAARPDESR
jgi:hypothetical protein